MMLRKSLAWIEEHESELNRISNIFQWERGLVVRIPYHPLVIRLD